MLLKALCCVLAVTVVGVVLASRLRGPTARRSGRDSRRPPR